MSLNAQSSRVPIGFYEGKPVFMEQSWYRFLVPSLLAQIGGETSLVELVRIVQDLADTIGGFDERITALEGAVTTLTAVVEALSERVEAVEAIEGLPVITQRGPLPTRDLSALLLVRH